MIEGRDGLAHLRPALHHDAGIDISPTQATGAGNEGVEWPQTATNDQEDGDKFQDQHQAKEAQVLQEALPKTLETGRRRADDGQTAVVATADNQRRGHFRGRQSDPVDKPPRHPRGIPAHGHIDAGALGRAPEDAFDARVFDFTLQEALDGRQVTDDDKIGDSGQLGGQLTADLAFDIRLQIFRLAQRRRYQHGGADQAGSNGRDSDQARQDWQPRPRPVRRYVRHRSFTPMDRLA